MLVNRMKTLVACLLLGISLGKGLAEEWPKDFAIEEESVSPDGHYGILIPSIDSPVEGENFGEVNYLADIKEHQVLGRIQDARYSERANHASLKTSWTPDSRLCLLEYQARYDIHSLVVVEVEAGKLIRQSSIAGPALKEIEAVMVRQMKGEKDAVCPWFYCRIDQDRKVLARSVASTNIKRREDRATYYAYFAGVYDVAAGRWVESEAVPVTEEKGLALSSLLDDAPPGNGFTEADGGYSEALQENLDEAYHALQSVLSPERFAQVKSQQSSWLKLRDAEDKRDARNAMTVKRILELRDMVWGLEGTGFLRG